MSISSANFLFSEISFEPFAFPARILRKHRKKFSTEKLLTKPALYVNMNTDCRDSLLSLLEKKRNEPKMMQKIFSLLLAVTVFLTVFAACDNSDENPTKTPTQEFTLAELPDIGEYKPKGSPTYFDTALTEFVPDDGYGTLAPYLGDMYEYYLDGGISGSSRAKDPYTVIPIYGLCTADGRIVTAPIYKSVEYRDGYYLLERFNLVNISDYLSSVFSGDTEIVYSIIPADGSFVTELKTCGTAEYCGDGIFAYYHSSSKNSVKTAYCTSRGEILYFDKGEFFDLTLSFYNGVALEENFVSESADGESEYAYRFVDTSFNTVSTPVEAKDFRCGLFSVGDGNGKYGVTANGKDMLLPVEYDGVFGDEKGIVAVKGSTAYAFDPDMKSLGTFDIGGDGLKNNVEAARIVSPDAVCFSTSYTDTFLLTTSGKKQVLSDFYSVVFYPDYGVYTASFNAGGIVFDRDLNRVFVTPANYIVNYWESACNIPVFYDTSELSMLVFNPQSGETRSFEFADYFSDFENFLLTGSPEKRTLALTDPVTGEQKTKVDSLARSLGTALGTLVFYDRGGYAYTVDENFNTVCCAPINED